MEVSYLLRVIDFVYFILPVVPQLFMLLSFLKPKDFFGIEIFSRILTGDPINHPRDRGTCFV